MENYIGKDKITLVTEVADKKSPTGEIMVEVNFENGKKEIMPKCRLETIATQEPSDYYIVALRQKVGATIFGILNEYGVKMGEINTCMDAAVELANNAFQKSSSLLFGDEYSMISLNRVNDILVNNMKENENGEKSKSESESESDTE